MQDLKLLVDTAHKLDIRIIFEINFPNCFY
jgi:glycosidase